MFINTTWTEFKDLLNRDRISVEYTFNVDYYVLYGVTSSIIFKLVLNKNTSDFDEFVSDFLAIANQRKGQLVVQKPLADTDNHSFDGQGFFKLCPASTITEVSYIIESESDMSGVEIIGAEKGDIVQMLVKDTPEGTYSTVPNYVLNKFGTNWFVRPEVFLKEIPYGARVYPGMVVAFLYDNKGIEKNVYINLDLHKLIES